MDFLTTTFNNALNAIRADMEEIINETDDAVDNNDSETHENVKKKKKAQKKEFEDTFLHMEKLIISQLPPVTNKGAMKNSKRTCTVLKKTDQYEWNDINTLHHDRLKTLLRVVGFTFSNHISVTVEELVRNVESNWEKIQEYYKKIDNAAEV